MFKSISLLTLFALMALPSFAQSNSVDEIRSQGTLKVGVANFAPWSFHNLNGDLEGFDIDIGYQIATDLGVAVEFHLLPLGEMPDALEKGDVDFIAAGLAITPARALEVDFTNPYFSTGTTVVVNRDLSATVDNVSALDSANIKIAVVQGTFSASIAAAYIEPTNLTFYMSPSEANAALVNGDAHGLFTNLPEARILVARHPDKLIAPLKQSVISSVAGLAVKRGNQDLLNFLNAWIASRKADTWLEKAHSYWFESFKWLSHSTEE